MCIGHAKSTIHCSSDTCTCYICSLTHPHNPSVAALEAHRHWHGTSMCKYHAVTKLVVISASRTLEWVDDMYFVHLLHFDSKLACQLANLGELPALVNVTVVTSGLAHAPLAAVLVDILAILAHQLT